MATSSVSLKLLIDTKSQKVLFAEAGKDFVDFLFNLLALPIGTVTKLLTKDKMVGSLGNLYDSIENLDETYLIQPLQTKEAILKPISLLSSVPDQVPLLPYYASASRKFYTCSTSYVAEDPETKCPNCKSKMSQEVSYVAKLKTQDKKTRKMKIRDKKTCKDKKISHEMKEFVVNGKLEDEKKHDDEVGFVKGVVTYMIMDDLVVKPMSIISSITMLNNFNIKEIGALKEKVVPVDMVQGIKLLRASLQSKAVLTSVFLHR